MLVRVKHRYQVTLPTALRRQAGVNVGDVLDVDAKNGTITFRAQRMVDRELALALDEVRNGKVESFGSMEEMIADLHRGAKARKRASGKHRAR